MQAHSHHGVTLRPAHALDSGFAERLYFATMRPLLTAIASGDVEGLPARFAQGYRQDRSKIICADGGDIGWMQVSATGTGLHLDQLHLLPDWRGRGIGGALLRRLLARAGRAGVEVGLDVIHGNPAIELYRRCGFRVVASDAEKNRMVWRRTDA